jgi:hypothetical protein
MASILIGAGALLSDKLRREKKLREEYARDFEAMKRENARLHAERQKMRQVQSGNGSSYPDAQPPTYDGTLRRQN